MKRSNLFLLLFLLSFICLAPGSVSAQTIWCGHVAPPPPPPPPPGPPPCCECEGTCNPSPNYIASGNYSTSAVDLSVPTRGLSLSLSRTYDSVHAVDGPFGKGWSSNFTGRLYYGTYLFSAPSTYYKEAIVLMPNGRPERFHENPDGTTYTPVAPSHDTLIKNGDGTFDLTLKQSRSVYHFAIDGSLLSYTDDYGNALAFSYDGSGRLTQVSDAPSARSLTFYYGADGRVSNVADHTGRSIGYIYNASGAMTSVTDPELRQTTYSYANGRFAPLLSQIKDNWNRVITTITYDTVDRTNSYTEAGETYTYTYKYQGNPFQAAKTDSAGNTWVFTFDAQGIVTNRVPPAAAGGAATNTVFNSDGTPQLVTDEVGVKTLYAYNANGSVASITRDYQGSKAVRFEYEYDPNFPEKVIAITPKNPSSGQVDPDWQSWKYDYYQSGSAAPGALFHVYRVQSDGTTLDTLATYTYNSAGQVLTVTDGTGAVTSYSYNSSTGDLESVTYPKNSDSGPNPVYQYGRDPLGRVLSVTDPLSHQTSYTYDDVDRILTVTLPKPSVGSPLNFVTTYTYDNYDAATGLVFTHQTDPNSKLTKQGFDQFGQLLRSIDAANNTTTFAYTKGLLTSITDANNNVTTYAYNALRRLLTTTFPDSSTEAYTYTADGLLNTKQDRKNQTITYNYDALKRLTSKVYPNASSITYTFTGQKLASVSDTLAGETHSFGYDASYRVSSNTQGTRGTLNYTYDAADRASSYAISGGASATYGHFADGSLKSIQWSPVSGQFNYTYTLNGQYGAITLPNSQVRNYTYDDQGRLTQIANTIGAGSLGTFAYGYDSPLLGQRTSMTDGLGTTNYSYDSNYQLTGATYPSGAPFNGEVHSWTYDNIGNRLTNTVNSVPANYTYYTNGSNPLNGQRLQSDGVKTYTYDANGNMIGDGTYTYTWDYENRLVGITCAGLTASYSYDYLGRRSSKTINGVITSYLYDGQNLIKESSASNVDYVFGPGIDEPIAMYSNAVVSYFDVDGLGSVNALNDSAGTLQNSYVFDAWGVTRSQSATVPNPFTYTAREFTEAGLYFYRARNYSSAIGRFLSEDPASRIFFRKNLYLYTANDPMNFRDPMGLVRKCASGRCPDCPSGIWFLKTVSLSFFQGIYGFETNFFEAICLDRPHVRCTYAEHCDSIGAGSSIGFSYSAGGAAGKGGHCQCAEDLAEPDVSYESAGVGELKVIAVDPSFGDEECISVRRTVIEGGFTAIAGKVSRCHTYKLFCM